MVLSTISQFLSWTFDTHYVMVSCRCGWSDIIPIRELKRDRVEDAHTEDDLEQHDKSYYGYEI